MTNVNTTGLLVRTRSIMGLSAPHSPATRSCILANCKFAVEWGRGEVSHGDECVSSVALVAEIKMSQMVDEMRRDTVIKVRKSVWEFVHPTKNSTNRLKSKTHGQRVVIPLLLIVLHGCVDAVTWCVEGNGRLDQIHVHVSCGRVRPCCQRKTVRTNTKQMLAHMLILMIMAKQRKLVAQHLVHT